MRYKSLNEEDVEIYRIDRRGYVLAASGIERVEQEQAQVEYKEEKKEKKKSEEELDVIDKEVKKILKEKPRYKIKIKKYQPVMAEGE
jgi:transcriptional regulatory protein LevR